MPTQERKRSPPSNKSVSPPPPLPVSYVHLNQQGDVYAPTLQSATFFCLVTRHNRQDDMYVSVC